LLVAFEGVEVDACREQSVGLDIVLLPLSLRGNQSNNWDTENTESHRCRVNDYFSLEIAIGSL
jgi:hypothetical protein